MMNTSTEIDNWGPLRIRRRRRLSRRKGVWLAGRAWAGFTLGSLPRSVRLLGLRMVEFARRWQRRLSSQKGAWFAGHSWAGFTLGLLPRSVQLLGLGPVESAPRRQRWPGAWPEEWL